MSFGQLLTILRARAGLIALVVLASLGLAGLVTSMWPWRYEATASVMVDPRADSAVLGTNYPLPALDNLVSTHRDLLNSPNVALRVVESLNLEHDTAATALLSEATPLSAARDWLRSLLPRRQGEAKSVKRWMAHRLQQNLRLDSNRDSRMIRVTYSSPDPDFSATIANAFVKSYRDTLLQLRVGPAKQNTQWYEQQLKDLRRNLEQAEAKVSKYQQEKGIVVASDDRLDLESARLADLSSQLVEAQTQGYDSSARQQQLRDFLAAKEGAAAPTEVLASPSVQQRQQDVAQREARLGELSQRVGKNHPEYLAATQELARARSRLREEMRIAAQGLTGSSSIPQEREAALRRSLQQQREKVLSLRKARAELVPLMQEADNARRAYDAAAQRYEQTRLEGEVDQTPVSSIVDSATAPTLPASPNAALNLLIGLLAGLALGIGLALFLETFQGYVRSEVDIAEILGVPVLAVLVPRAVRRQSLLRLNAPNVYKRLQS